MKYILFLFLMLAGLSACTTVHRFRTLARPEHPGESPFGAVLALGYYEDQFVELLAVNDSVLWVLAHDTAVQIPRARLSSMTVHVMRTNEDPRSTVLFGNLSFIPTLAHGFYALVTGPANLLISRAVGYHATHGTYRLKYPKQVGWTELHRYARYPQGLPPACLPQTIKMPGQNLNYTLPFSGKK